MGKRERDWRAFRSLATQCGVILIAFALLHREYVYIIQKIYEVQSRIKLYFHFRVFLLSFGGGDIDGYE